MDAVLRTIIVDSEPESRARLRRILAATPSVAIVGEFAGPLEVLREAWARRPDVLVVEVSSETGTPAGGGCAIVQQLARVLPDTAIVATGPGSLPADAVLQVIRAGALEFLRRPVEASDLAAALAKVARFRRGTVPERGPAQVISVFSPKGGLGVTTVATNLAVCLAERAPDRTLLVGLEPHQSDVGTFLNLRSPYCVLDAFENLERLDEAFLRGLLAKHPSGLCVLLGPSRIDHGQCAAEPVPAALEILRSHMDHVILDLPHEINPITIAALEASDMILFLTTLNVAALRAGALGLAAFLHLGLDLQKVRTVIMRAETGEDVTLKHAREALSLPIFWRIPNDYVPVVAAINSGQPVLTASPRSKVAKNLRELSERLRGTPATIPGRSLTSVASQFGPAWIPKKISGVG